MAWTAPKTDWKVTYGPDGEYTGDFFNVEDYDRIKQNIEYLREYAYFLYGGFTMRGMVAVTVESYGYASTMTHWTQTWKPLQRIHSGRPT